MPSIPITDLQSGMKLAQDIVDNNGRKLLSCGDTLSEQSLRVLKIWGVHEAEIEDNSEPANNNEKEQAVSEEHLLQAKAITKIRFGKANTSHPAMRELLKLSLKRSATLLSQGQTITSLPAPSALPTAKPEPVSIQNIVRDTGNLGSLPALFHQLIDVVNDSRSSATDVAEVISSDTDLTARLLRIVNSPFYGMRTKIDTISRAVTVIGSNQLVSLAMGISIISFFKGVPETLITMRQFWEHSIGCGAAARILASHHKMQNSERFFVAGLLHDIGRLVTLTILPEHACYLLSQARKQNTFVQTLEKDIVGFTHDRLAGLLLKEWKCPVSLEKNVRYHHNPMLAPNTLEASILHIANIFASAMQFGSSGEELVQPLDSQAWALMQIPLSAIPQIVTQMEFQISELIRLMEVDA